MPLYDYACSKCDYEFRDLLRVDDRKIPETKKCPSCNKKGVKIQVGAPAIGDSVRLGITKPSSQFKEVLQKIHENTPGSKLKEKLSGAVKDKRSL